MKSNSIFIIVTIVLIIYFTNCRHHCHKKSGSGLLVTKFLSFSNFNNIIVNSHAVIYLTKNEKNSVRIQTDDNLINDIKCRKLGNNLFIYNDNCAENNSELNIFIGVNFLKRIKLNTDAYLFCEDTFYTDKLIVSIKNTGKMILLCHCKDIYIRLTDSSHLRLAGSAINQKILQKGHSLLHAENFKVKNTNIDLQDNSKSIVYTTLTLAKTIDMNAVLNILGTPRIIEKDK